MFNILIRVLRSNAFCWVSPTLWAVFVVLYPSLSCIMASPLYIYGQWTASVTSEGGNNMMREFVVNKGITAMEDNRRYHFCKIVWKKGWGVGNSIELLFLRTRGQTPAHWLRKSVLSGLSHLQQSLLLCCLSFKCEHTAEEYQTLEERKTGGGFKQNDRLAFFFFLITFVFHNSFRFTESLYKEFEYSSHHVSPLLTLC